MAAVSTRPNDSKTSRRALPVVSLGRFPTQISILCPFPSYGTPIYGGRAKRQQTREMGLEAGQASVTHDRASRLHQAIILSSEQHATDRHCTTGRRPCNSFYLFLQNSFIVPSAAQIPQKPGANGLFGKQYRPRRGIVTRVHVSVRVSHMMNDRSCRDEEHVSGGDTP